MTYPTPYLQGTLIPTGGAVRLDFNTSIGGTIALARAVSVSGVTGPFTTIYSGPPFSSDGQDQYFFDVGDGMPSPLSASTAYVYQLTDGANVLTLPPISPTNNIELEFDQLSAMLLKLLQGMIDTMEYPAGTQKATVQTAMPLTGLPPLPIVVFAPVLFTQEYQEIGDDVIKPDVNNISRIDEMIKRNYMISVITQNPRDREFYRDALIAWWKVTAQYVLSPIGLNISHTYMVNHYQITDNKVGMQPGFYGFDLLITFMGNLNLIVNTQFGKFMTITTTVSDESDNVLIEAEVTGT